MMTINETLIQRAMQYPLDRVLERYTLEKGVSGETAKEHARELKRYLALRALNPGARYPLAAGPVDELWHNFLLYTIEYSRFCEEVASAFIHHHPGPANPTEEEVRKAQRDFDRFLTAYNETFHESPPIHLWPRIGEPGVLWSC